MESKDHIAKERPSADVGRMLRKVVNCLRREIDQEPECLEVNGPLERGPKAIARAMDNEQSLLVVVVVYPAKVSLTPRETDVVRHIGYGLGNRGIARKIGMSTKTVEKHIERVKAKWNINTRAQIARYAALDL